MKRWPRLSLFLIGLRWASLLSGTFFLSFKAANQSAGTLHALLWSHNSILIFFLVVLELMMSILQWKSQDNPAYRWGVMIADALCGLFLVFVWGSTFFFLAILIPILES